MRSSRMARAGLATGLLVAVGGPVGVASAETRSAETRSAASQAAARAATNAAATTATTPPPRTPALTLPTRDCAGLKGLTIPAGAIGLATSGGVVTDAAVVAATGTAATSIVEHCRVSASLRPVDPKAPEIRMQVALPSRWNNKTVMFGGGGYNGTIPNVAQNVPFGPGDELAPLGRGYATYASDSGHQATPGFVPTASLDGSFLANDEALRNFAGDALKKTHDAARYVLRNYYTQRAPQLSYFAGGSTGGREALAVAQRWPRDFNGVISIYPAFNAAALDLFFGFMAQQFAAPGAFPRPAQQTLLYNAVIKACDDLDGATDGVIGDEASCRFDPEVLRCPEDQDVDTCLTPAQIRAIKAVSSPLSFPYRTGGGETGYPGFPYLSGANMTTPLLGVGTVAPANPMPTAAGYGVQFWDQWVRFAVTRDPSYNSLTLDPLAPGAYQQRISDLTALQEVNDSNLRPFARNGGKLLLVHGTADELVSHRSTVDYYHRLLRTMGPAQVHRFSRFYLVPGANHANVNAAYAAGWDSLSALDRWVTTGQPPTQPVVTDRRPGANRTRPLCEYPTYPHYNGVGDVNFASSFTCVRSSALLQSARVYSFGGRASR